MISLICALITKSSLIVQTSDFFFAFSVLPRIEIRRTSVNQMIRDDSINELISITINPNMIYVPMLP